MSWITSSPVSTQIAHIRRKLEGEERSSSRLGRCAPRDQDIENARLSQNGRSEITLNFRLDGILERSDRHDRRANEVARLEKRPGRRADTRRGSRGDDVSRFERDELRDERNDRGDRENHLRRRRLLLDLTVDRQLQRQVLRIGHRARRKDARPHRTECVVPLAVQPVEELVTLARLAARVGLERLGR